MTERKRKQLRLADICGSLQMAWSKHISRINGVKLRIPRYLSRKANSDPIARDSQVQSNIAW